MRKYDIKLNYNELIGLDGQVSEEAQKVIDIAKKEKTIGFDFEPINEIIRNSEEKGSLTWRYKGIRACSHCDKGYEYQRYARNSRWHRKGDKNFDKPIHHAGIEFNAGVINFVGHGDMCRECADKNKVIEKMVDFIIHNDLKIQIQKNDFSPSKYLKDDIRTCFNCDEEMKESEMTKEMTMMGDGHYAAGCPKCGAVSRPFGRSHGVTRKFDFILNPKFKEAQADESEA